MWSLQEHHPLIYQEFCSGGFVACKTQQPFSAIALDHAHEQTNPLVKGDGGAVGLTENPSALLRWMVAGPELCRMVEEFVTDTSRKESTKHHEQTPSAQASFANEVTSLVSTINEMGNPFTEDNGDLLTLDTKVIMNSDVVNTVKNVRALGEEQYNRFVKERFEKRSKSIKELIRKNKLPLFSDKNKALPKQKAPVTALKDDCSLFSRLYIACQTREGNLEDFFKHENQPWPPSLSNMGEMRSGNKADLLAQLERGISSPSERPKVTALLLDGAMIVQMLPTGTSKTFQDYIDSVFLPYISKQLKHVDRLDIVWDVYIQDSLKAATRDKRGKGLR